MRSYLPEAALSNPIPLTLISPGPEDATSSGSSCKICGEASVEIGSKTGKWRKQTFHLRRCSRCRYSFISDPLSNLAEVYSPEYYRGTGADPLLDYVFELEHPAETVRQYEWRGILRAVNSLFPLSPDTTWLDYGCGNGGLVRYCRERCHIAGFEAAGWIRDQSRDHGITVLGEQDLVPLAGSFDIVSAIEVLEHVPEPLEILSAIRRLLKPGGLFFYTTGNAQPHNDDLVNWPYVLPETHVSFFEPDTLVRALSDTGFRPEFRGYLPGHTDIIRFKVLKNLRLLRQAAWHVAVPWEIVARMIDRRLKISGHPIAWAV